MADDELLELANKVASQLIANKLVLTLAESCTGGLVSGLLTEISGSSQWFDSGYVVYSNAAKQDMLHVPDYELDFYGAVSEEVAAAMAAGALHNGRANIAASVTGIAGPSGGTETKPVGMVCFGWAGNDRLLITTTKYFKGNRRKIRDQAIKACLEGILKLTLNADL